MGKALAIGVLLPGDGHGAQADTALPGIQLPAPGISRHLDSVQGLLPIAVGPPQLGMLDQHFFGGTLPLLGIALGIGDLHRVGDSLSLHIVHLRLDGQGNSAPLVALAHQHMGQSGAVHALEGHGAPQPGIGQMGTPVPAKHAVGLAQIGKSPHGVGTALGRAFCVLLPDPPGGGI